MSSNRGSYKSLHPDIRQYRDIAPESLSDEVLLKLVHDNGKNPVAVKEALEALWNEEPAGQWVTNEKKSKKATPPPQTSNERGGRGRGRSAPPGRGDSGRGGRGSGGRSSSVSTNTQNGRPRVSSSKTENSNTSTPNQFSKIEETEKTETVTETSTSNTTTTSSSTTTTPSSTTTASAVAATKTTKLSTAPVWGSGPSLAQKIREQELAASAPPPPPPVVVVEEEVRVESVEEVQTNSVAPVSSSSAGHSRRSPRTEGGRGRGRKRGGRDSQPPRSTHITSEANNNNSDNNNEKNNNNNNINNDNIDENNINNSNNHVEQVVEENVEESVEQVVESIQNVHIEKIAEEIPEPVQNNNILQNDITNNNTHNVQVIPDILMSPPRSNNPVTVSDTLVGSPVLKMGRWGASLESTDVSSFQFGSFGNLGHDNSSSVNDGDESPHKIASGLISSLTESQNTWGQQSQLDQNSLTQSDHETENVASLSVWGNTQSQNDNPDDSYNYDQQVSSSANDNSVHSAPPGLGLSLGGLDTSSVVNQSGSNKSGNNRNSNRSAPGQTRKNDIDNNISRQPQSYYQGPPGMQPGGFGIPYGYGFDMNTLQPPTVGYGATTQTNSTSPGAPGTNSNGQAVNQNTNTNNNNQNNSNQNTANNYNNANTAATGNNAPKYPGPPGMPAQMGAYPPYYANPYYSQAYFYGGAQPQNFYGRGGQAMYPPRPYGADPYAPPMPGYDMYGQPGQFGDAVYGQIPMQPMHPQQNATSNDNRQNNGKGGNKNVGPNTQQSAGAVGGVTGTSTNVGTTQPDANQAIHSGYGMGAYNAYGRADQGAAWPPYQAWNQMMFPPGVGLGGGYSPMGGIPPQPTNNRHDQTSRGGGGSGSYNSYGRGAGSSTNGQNDSTGIGGGTASW